MSHQFKKKSRKFLPFDWKRKSYDARDSIVKKLGFSSYRQYLSSPLWQDIRSRYLAKYSTCFGCGKPANQIHHKFYSEQNLSGKDLNGMFSICGECHERIEFKPSGMKVNVGEANRWLFKIRKENFPKTERQIEKDRVRKLARRQKIKASKRKQGDSADESAVKQDGSPMADTGT